MNEQIVQEEIHLEIKKRELSFLHATNLLGQLSISTKYDKVQKVYRQRGLPKIREQVLS